PTRTFAPGDCIGSLEVIASPGHTPGHVAFLDRRDQTLIAGDAFQTRGGIAVAGVVQPFFPLPAIATWHKATALRSAEALRALEPARLAVGHGPVLAAPLAAMDRAIAVARRRFQEPGAHAA
ncbi:MAG TPA: MBL fold metallo-hydrolase, partial [Ktedonobacterales bacterium]